MKRVLIVEDNPFWVSIFISYCKQLKLESIVANSPQAAMDVLDNQKIDLVILDMLLAAETGMALLGEMRGYEDLSNIPVIVCTNVEGISIRQLEPFGVRYLFDKSDVEPVDIRLALRRLTE